MNNQSFEIFEKSSIENELNKYKKIKESIFEKSKKYNLDGIEVMFSGSRNFSLSSFNKKISKFNLTDSSVCGLRVIKDQKIGINSTERLDEEGIDYLLESTINTVKFVEEDHYQEISSKVLSNDLIHQENFSDSVPKIDQQIDFIKNLESSLLEKSDKVQSVPYNNYNQSISYSLLSNNNGLLNTTINKYFSFYASVLLKENKDNATFFKGSMDLSFDQLDLNSCVNSCYEIANDLLSSKKPDTGRYDVMFDVNSLSSLFNAFFPCFSGQYAMNGLSLFQDKINQEVSSKNLTIIDDPHCELALVKDYIDDEGFVRKKTKIIENGIFKTFLHNSKTAKYFDVSNTFNASRSPKGVLNIAPSYIRIQEGNDDNESLKSRKYIEIIKLDGIHAGTNPTSGDFSLMSTGNLYENGVKKSIKEFTVTGNFYEMLKNINFVGNKLERSDFYSFFTPKIIFQDLSISS